MQARTHYENGCSQGKRLSVRRDASGEHLKSGVSIESFYKAATPCNTCSKILANEWQPIPETNLYR